MSIIASLDSVGIVDSTQNKKSFSLLFFRTKHRLATFPVVKVLPCEEAKSIMIFYITFSNPQRKFFALWTFTELGDHLLTPAFR